MEPIIKKIKTDLKPLKTDFNLRLKHINNNYQEILEYTDYYGLNFKKHNLVCKFILQKKENSLTFTYNYVCNKKNCDITKEYSFMSNDIEKYPCFTDADVSRIKELYDFSTEDNIIKNSVSLETQADVLLDIFKKRFKKLTEFVKKQASNKETPE